MDITLQEIKKEDTSVLFQLFQLFSYDTSEFSEKDVESGCFHGYDVLEYTTSSNYISYFIKANVLFQKNFHRREHDGYGKV